MYKYRFLKYLELANDVIHKIKTTKQKDFLIDNLHFYIFKNSLIIIKKLKIRKYNKKYKN
jgi:hypothetical protein